MNRLSFDSYVRELDSRIILTYLSPENGGGVIGERVYEQILERFVSHDSVIARWQSLTEEQRAQIFQVYLAGDMGLATSAEDSSAELLKSFLVYEGQILGKKALFGFVDIAPFLIDLFVELHVADESVGQNQLCFNGLAGDFAIVLSMIRHGDFKRRQDGILLKTTLDQFIATSMLGRYTSTGNSEHINFLVETVLIFLMKQSIIRFTTDGYELFYDGESRWASQIGSLTDSYLTFVQAIQNIADMNVVHSVISAGASFDSATISDRSLIAALQILTWCGKIVYVENHFVNGVKCEVPPIETGHIMPDFTVLFPREIHPFALYRLLQLAQIEQIDQLCRARISRELISDSLSRGVPAELLKDLLLSWNCSPHMLHTIDEWFYSFDRVFVDGNYLAISARAGDFIAQHPEIESLLTPFSEYRFYRIQPEAQMEVKTRLEKMGFDHRMPFAGSAKVKADHPRVVEMVAQSSPQFAPELDRSEPVQTNFGKYGGALRSQTLVELLKIVRFAILMEEKVAVILHGETEPRTCMPIDVRTGENGAVIGKNDTGGTEEFRLDLIDKIGVVQN